MKLLYYLKSRILHYFKLLLFYPNALGGLDQDVLIRHLTFVEAKDLAQQEDG